MSSSHSDSTRREFLKGKAAVRAARGLLPADSEQAAPDAGPEQNKPSSRYLIHVGRRAMACQFDLIFNAGQYALASESAVAALDLVDRLESQLSVYRDDSEIGLVNRQACQDFTPVSHEVYSLIDKGLRIYRDTDGAYDLTSGPLSAAWGFLKRAGQMPTEAQLEDARQRIGSCHVHVDPSTLAVRYGVEGLQINFNSIGKGYALDRCAALLHDAGIRDFLLHGGQSSVLAAGNYAGTPDQGWSVGIRHPLRPDRRLATLHVSDRALGTSGSGTQYFHYAGKRYGHVIDPRTGRPAEGVLSVTVIAAEAAEADALATAFYVLGPDRTAEYCRTHQDVGAVMTCPGSRPDTVEASIWGLQPELWQWLDERVPVTDGC